MKEMLLHPTASAPDATILDVDASPLGTIAATLEMSRGRVYVSNGLPGATSLFSRQIPLPIAGANLEKAHVRALDSGASLIFDSLPLTNENAWLVGSDGQLLETLELGGALDAMAVPGGFAVGFHPGGAENNGVSVSPMAETSGIAFFDLTGEPSFSLNDRLRSQRLEVHNVLAMAPFGPTGVIFVPESLWQGERVRDCPLVIYDWKSDEVRWWASPLLDPLAVSGRGSDAFIFSPIGFDGQILRLDLESLQIRPVGACPQIERGLDQGLFLAHIKDSIFSIVNPLASVNTTAWRTPRAPRSGNTGPETKDRARLEIVR